MTLARFVVTLLICVFSFTAFSNTDSLRTVINKNSDLKSKALACIYLGNQLENSYPDSALHFYNLGVTFAQQAANDTVVGKLYGNMAFCYFYVKQNLDSTKWAIAKSIEAYNKVDFYEGTGYAYFNLGVFCFNNELYDETIEAYIQGLHYAELAENFKLIEYLRSNLGLVYQYQGYYNLAVQEYLLAYNYLEFVPKENALNLQFNLALNYLFANRYQEAISEYKALLKNEFEHINPDQNLLSHLNIGESYLSIQEYDSAKKYIELAELFAAQMPDNPNSHEVLLFKAKYLVETNNNTEAFNLITQTLANTPNNLRTRLRISLQLLLCETKLESSNLSNSELNQLEVYATEAYSDASTLELFTNKLQANKVLVLVYARMNKPQLVAEFANKLVHLSDSVQEVKQLKAVSEAQIKFESELLANEVQNLSTQNAIKEENLAQAERIQNSQWVIILLFALGLTVVVVLWQKLKLSSKNLEQTNLQLTQQNEIIVQQNTEKELLLQEVHHRVKNNLQIISSLLDLQSRNSTNQEVQQAIAQSKNRISSMALIHQMLYQSNQFAAVNTKEYLQQLANSIVKSSAPKNLKLELIINPQLNFAVSTCIPLGLILNELITNSIKYAFEGIAQPKITLQITAVQNNEFIFQYYDNGVGLPPDFKLETAKSLGMRLVNRLSKQLKGNLHYEYLNGSVFTFNFCNLEA